MNMNFFYTKILHFRVKIKKKSWSFGQLSGSSLIHGPTFPWTYCQSSTSKGHTTILRVVDWFSMMAHFIPLPKLPSAKETAKLALQCVFRLRSLPTNIVSHRGP